MFSATNTKIRELLIILSFIILPTGYLQAQNVISTNDLRRMAQEMHGAGIMTFQATKYIGSPFLTKWQRGYLILKGNEKSNILLLRYNMWKNNVQFTRNKKVYMIPGKKLSGFVIRTSDGNISFRNGFKTDQGHINPNTLLRVIYTGNIKLLAHYSSTLLKNIATYGTAVKKSKFIKHTRYFLQTPDSTFHEVKLKRKDILGVLSNHRNKVKKYAKKHHLSFKSKKGLKKILAYHDRINSDSDK